MSESASLEVKVNSEGVALAAERLKALAARSGEAERAAKGLADEQRRVSDEAKRTREKEFEDVRRSLLSQEQAIRESYQRRRKIIEENTTGPQRSSMLNQLDSKTSSELKSIGAGASGTEVAVDSLTSSLGRLAIPLVGSIASMAGLHKVVGETSQFDALIGRLEGVAGGAEEAREKFDELELISDKTMASENEMTEAFLHLQQTGLDGSTKSLQGLSNMAAATGTTIGALSGTVVSASMGMTRGLRQFGISAEKDGDKIKMTFRGVTTTITDSAQDIEKYIVGLGNTMFAGAAERQLDTMGGAVKKLEDAWGDLFREIGRSPVGDFIKTGMGVAADAINLATSAVEGFFYTMSKKPKAMSAERTANLNNWLGGAEGWGKEDDPQGDLWPLLADIDKRKKNDGDVKLAKYQEERQRLIDASVDPALIKAGFDSGAAIADLDAVYAKESGGTGQVDKSAAEAARKKRKEDIKFVDKTLATLDDSGRAEAWDRADKAMESNEKELKALRDSLRTQEEVLKDSYLSRIKIIEENPSQPDYEELRQKEVDHYAAELGALKDAKAQELEELRSVYYSDEEALKASQERRLQLILTSTALEGDQKEELLRKDAEKRQQEQEKYEMALATTSMKNSEMLFGNLAAIARKGAGEQSKVYKTLFAVQKGFAIAEGTLNVASAISNASRAPYPANIPLMIEAAATGASLVAQIMGANYSGAFDRGGDIARGRIGLVGEYGPEFVAGPANITSRADTRRLLENASNNSGKQTQPAQTPNFRLITLIDPSLVHEHMGSDEGEQVIMQVVKRNGETISRLARS